MSIGDDAINKFQRMYVDKKLNWETSIDCNFHRSCPCWKGWILANFSARADLFKTVFKHPDESRVRWKHRFERPQCANFLRLVSFLASAILTEWKHFSSWKLHRILASSKQRGEQASIVLKIRVSMVTVWWKFIPRQRFPPYPALHVQL